MTVDEGVLQKKEAVLDARLRALGSVLVAYSGGVDSAYLAVRARIVLGDDKTLAVTADSASLADAQRQMARRVAGEFSLRHRFVSTDELDDPLYLRNEADRCFRCKTELFRKLVPMAAAEGLAHVAYGLIADDLTDFRPGHRAAAEAGVVSPLADAGLSKEDVRAFSRALGLPTADLPASPCLSSRVPYGTVITPAILRRVERAEAAVQSLGFRELRVRHLGDAARVEIAREEMAHLADGTVQQEVQAAVREAGYAEAVIDADGYRRGRLNEERSGKVPTAG